MNTNPATITPSDFDHHAEWLRGLARRLVKDEHLAEDLAQDAWVRAMERPPDRDRPLRAWLTTVTSNLARYQARSTRNRDARHRRLAAPVSAPAPDETLERAEALQLLVDHLMQMAEPFRSTLLLHFESGLTSAEIADHLDVPQGTVRWRLKTGLDRLRVSMDTQTKDGRAGWISAMAPLVRQGNRGASTTAGQSISSGKWIIAAMLVVVSTATLSALFLWPTHRPEVVESGESSRASAPAPPPPAPITPTRLASAVVANEPGAEEPTATEEASAPRAIAEGVVTTFDGVPIEGAVVEWMIRSEYHYQPGTDSVVSGQGGVFRIPVPDDTQASGLHDVRLYLLASDQGYASSTEAWRSGTRTTIRLAPAGTIQGRVSEFETGKAIVGASVCFGYGLFENAGVHQRRGGALQPVLTDVDGSYRFDGIPQNQELSITVRRPGHADHGQWIEIDSGPATTLDIRIPRGFDLSGRAIDAESGAAVPHASLAASGNLVTSDAQGFFSIRGVQKDGLLFNQTPGYCTSTIAISAPAGSDLERTATCTLPMIRSCTLQGVIRDRNGAPVKGAVLTLSEDLPADALDTRYAAFRDAAARVFGPLDEDACVSDEAGRFLWGDRVPFAIVKISARDPVSRELIATRTSTLGAPGSENQVDLSPTQGGAIEGTATVGGAPDRIAITWVGGGESRTVWTETGDYRTDGIPFGDVAVHAFVNSAKRATRHVQVVPGEVARCDFDIEDLRTPIAGIVRDPDGSPRSGVAITPTPPGTWAAYSDEDGRFQMEIPVAPGTPLQLRLDEAPFRIVGVPAVAGREDLELVFPRTVRQRFRIVDAVNGGIIPRVTVTWNDHSDHPIFLDLADDPLDAGPEGVSALLIPEGTFDLHFDADRLGYTARTVEGIRFVAGRDREIIVVELEKKQ